MGGEETELKLRLSSPEALETLRKNPLLTRLAAPNGAGKPRIRLLHSVYFDTPERALHAQGLSLRVRHEGRKRIQTLKTAPPPGAGLFVRQEYESPITSDTPDPTRLREILGPESDPRILDALIPAFETRVRRETRLLCGRGWKIEMALDTGEIIAADAQLPVLEIELELRQGSPARLFDLAQKLGSLIPLGLSSASKSERGYRLSARETAKPRKAPIIELPESTTAAEAFRRIGRSCLSHLLVNLDCLLETGDAEAVHQMRVAARRFRSALNLFRGPLTECKGAETVKDDLRWLTGELAPARDSDVFLAEIIAPLCQHFPAEESLEALRAHFANLREDHYRRALAAAQSQKLAKAFLNMRAWVEDGDWQRGNTTSRLLLAQGAKDFATQHLERLFAKAAKMGGSLVNLTPENRHRLRIRIKRLRYAIEFFQSLFPRKRLRRFLERLNALQDALGSLNDIAVAKTLLAGADSPHRDFLPPLALGLALGWHESRVVTLCASAQNDWNGLTAEECFWRET